MMKMCRLRYRVVLSSGPILGHQPAEVTRELTESTECEAGAYQALAQYSIIIF
jgi:hypothetical protein